MSRSRGERLPEIDVIWEGDGEADLSTRSSVVASVLAGLGFLVVAAVLLMFLIRDRGDGSVEKESTPATDARFDAAMLAESLPEELMAAELYRAAPGPDTLASLLAAVGGLDGLVLGRAEGAFDVVTFDPSNPDHLLASRRSSYGPAENQSVNEEWWLSDGDVSQALFAQDVTHDVAHFNSDGTVAVWVNSGNTTAFASRTVTLQSEARTTTSDPLYASRSVIVSGTLFALTGSEDYYSTDRQFESLIADSGGTVTMLDAGEYWAWIDSPQPHIVIAYPVDDLGATMVWDAETLEPIPDHPFAGHPFLRLAVSEDGRTAVGVTADGQLQVVDPTTGARGNRFGSLNPEGIAQPITVNADGTIAITIDWSGTVTLWWVGHDQPLAVAGGDAGPARVVAEHRAPRTSSAVEHAAQRFALQQTATPEKPTTWTIIDADPDKWVERACSLAARTLTTEQQALLGLSRQTVACP